MPKPLPTRIAKFTRVSFQGGCYYTTPSLKRGRCSLAFFDQDKVPHYEGDEAWFEVEHVHNGARIVRILRQVPEPPMGPTRPL